MFAFLATLKKCKNCVSVWNTGNGKYNMEHAFNENKLIM